MLSRERRLDLACLLGLAGVVAAFFWPVLLQGYWIPRGGGDLVSFLWPMARFSARSLRAGTIPLWNPYLYGGAPFVADNQSGVFYPLNLLTAAIVGEPSYAVMEVLVGLHIWLAAANAYLLARGLALRRAAALYAGIAFAFSDLFVTHIGNLNLNAAAAWLPLLVLCTHRALTRHSTGWAAAAGSTLAVAALAGHAQILLLSGVALVVYVLYRLVVDWRQGARRALHTAALGGLIAVVAATGAALMILPAYQMAGHTGRGHLTYSEATAYSLPPRALLGLLAPGFYGRGPAGFWGPWDRVEVGYAGAPTLVLAALGAGLWLAARVDGRRSSQDARPRVEDQQGLPLGFFVVLVFAGFALALGSYAPFYEVLYRFVPAFDQIRVPARFILLGDFGLVMLAACGLNQLLGGSGRRWGRWGSVVTVGGVALLLVLGLPAAANVPPPDRVMQARNAILTAAALLGASSLLTLATSWHRSLGALFVVLVSIDLIVLGSTVEVDPNDPTLGFQHEAVVQFLRSDTAMFRIESTAAAWQPDAALVHGLYDMGGVYNPLALAPYDAYRWAVGERGSPLYNLLGVKYVLADKEKPPGDERFVSVYAADPDIDVYLNTTALPRALLVRETQFVADHTAAWDAIHADDFDPAQTVVLEQGEPLRPDTGGGEAHMAFLRYYLNDVELSVQTADDAYLVLSDGYYPGWHATVDGVAADVLRADYVFRAVRVPAGEHTVRLWFAPITWTIGVVISALAWGLIAACGVLWLRRARQP